MRNTAKENVLCGRRLFFEKIENELADSLDNGRKTRTCLKNIPCVDLVCTDLPIDDGTFALSCFTFRRSFDHHQISFVVCADGIISLVVESLLRRTRSFDSQDELSPLIEQRCEMFNEELCLTCRMRSLSLMVITRWYVLPIDAINMFSRRMGVRIMKTMNKVFTR